MRTLSVKEIDEVSGSAPPVVAGVIWAVKTIAKAATGGAAVGVAAGLVHNAATPDSQESSESND
ncbi:hypothetical protein RYZ27_09035 [Hyphomonas sp. FCG-A18]|uniref:hypothetical protein n=1 Tax=Hyphomonas sp. FCG-A18 TaxID=3080019 RepID=UPI002B314B90|nr:hypothetical protein RYZ27_09035 [Hyphomonas sp. FCG-A18]